MNSDSGRLRELGFGGHTGAHEQLQTPKLRQHFGGKACPFSHRDQDVEVRQLPDDLVRVHERPREHLDVGVERTPVSEAQSSVLVVVENANLQAKHRDTSWMRLSLGSL